MARNSSTAIVIIPSDPPGRKVCAFLRAVARDRSKVMVIGQSGKLAPGNLEKLLLSQLPDVTKVKVFDMAESGGSSVSDALELLESMGEYRSGQSIEVFCAKDVAQAFATEIRDGQLDLDPTVISVHPSGVPSDSLEQIMAAAKQGTEALKKVLDPHIFTDENDVRMYIDALGQGAGPFTVGGESQPVKETYRGGLPNISSRILGLDRLSQLGTWGADAARAFIDLVGHTSSEVTFQVLPAPQTLYASNDSIDDMIWYDGQWYTRVKNSFQAINGKTVPGKIKKLVPESVMFEDSRGNIKRLLGFTPQAADFFNQFTYAFLLAKVAATFNKTSSEHPYNDPEANVTDIEQDFEWVVKDLNDAVHGNIAIISGQSLWLTPAEALDKLLARSVKLRGSLGVLPAPGDWPSLISVFKQTLADIRKPIDPADIVLDVGGDMKWVDLKTSYSGEEAAMMNHCGTDHCGNLISLRDANNNAHVTMTWNRDENKVYQLRGKGNAAPVRRYHDAIVQFFKKFHPEQVDSFGAEIDALLLPFQKQSSNESIIREFLSALSPNRAVAIDFLHEMLASFLEEWDISIDDCEYLGTGRNGSAYRAPGGEILKITTDPAEIESAKVLVDQSSMYIHLVYGVTDLSEGVAVIVQEGNLTKLPSAYTDEFDTAIEIIEAVGASHALREGNWAEVLHLLERSTDPGLVPLVHEVAEKFGLEGMCDEVAALGLSADFHSGNIMLRDGCPVLTDLGTPGDDTGMNESIINEAQFDWNQVLGVLVSRGLVDENSRPLGEGYWGIAFKGKKPGTVVKVTDHADEARVAKKIVGKNIPGIIKVLSVDGYYYGDHGYLYEPFRRWVIETEELFPLDDATAKLLFKATSTPESEKLRGKSQEAEYWESVLPGLGAVVQSAHKLGFTPDVHEGNVMKRADGSLVLSDIGPTIGSEVRESVVLELLKDIGGERGARAIVDQNRQLLAARGINNVGQPLGKGQMGLAFDIGGGKVLKVTTDTREAATVNKLIGKSMKHVVRIYDAFQFPNVGAWGFVSEKCAPLTGDDENNIMDVCDWIRDERVIDTAATKRWNDVVTQVRSVMREDALADGAGTNRVEAIVGRQIADFMAKAKATNIDAMIDELRGAGIQFADYKPDNIMKRGSDFVLIDLSMSKTGEGDLGESGGPGIGGATDLRGLGSSAWSAGPQVLAKPEQHVPEDEDDQVDGIDFSFYAGGGPL